MHHVPAAPVSPARRGTVVELICPYNRYRVLIGYRKKKCDESHPRCSDCRRLNLPCQWSASSTGRKINSSEIADPPSPIPYATASDDGVSIDDSDGGPRMLSPISPSDAAEFIATLFPPSLSSQSTFTLSLNLSPISANPYLRTDNDRSLFNHYIHVVAKALCRSYDPDRNPFLVTILPLAAASDMVTSVILTLSGCHWRRVYPSIWRCALTHQGQGRGYLWGSRL